MDAAVTENLCLSQGEFNFEIDMVSFELEMPGCCCLQSETCPVCCNDVDMPSPTLVPTVPTYWEHLVSLSRKSSATPSFTKRKPDVMTAELEECSLLQLCEPLKKMKLDENGTRPPINLTGTAPPNPTAAVVENVETSSFEGLLPDFPLQEHVAVPATSRLVLAPAWNA